MQNLGPDPSSAGAQPKDATKRKTRKTPRKQSSKKVTKPSDEEAAQR